MFKLQTIINWANVWGGLLCIVFLYPEISLEREILGVSIFFRFISYYTKHLGFLPPVSTWPYLLTLLSFVSLFSFFLSCPLYYAVHWRLSQIVQHSCLYTLEVVHSNGSQVIPFPHPNLIHYNVYFNKA